MSKIPAKKTGFSVNRLLRLRRAGFLHVTEVNGRLLYDSDEVAACPSLIEKASETLILSGQTRGVGRPDYKKLATVLGLAGAR